jgi:hypothetical protein
MKKFTHWTGFILLVALAVFALPALSYLIDFPEFKIPKSVRVIVCAACTIALAIMYIGDIAAFRREKSATRRVKPPLKNGIGAAVLIIATLITAFI